MATILKCKKILERIIKRVRKSKLIQEYFKKENFRKFKNSYHDIANLQNDLLLLTYFHEGNKYYITIKYKNFNFSNKLNKF